MSVFSVRQALLSDVEALVSLFDDYRQFYGQRSDPSGARFFLSERLQRSQSVILVAESNGAFAGFIQLYPSFSSVSMACTFVLNDLFVEESMRRNGVAKLLLQAAAEFAKAAGAIRLSLSTAVSNDSAQALYQAAGWSRDERFYVYTLGLQT